MTRGARIRGEIAATFALGWPIVITNLALNFMTTTDVMMMGWLSPESLAAGSLGFNLYTPILLFAIGLVGAASPLAASRLGADPRDIAGVRRVGHQALISALAITLPAWLLLWQAAPLLRALGEPPELAAAAGRYMHGLQWALAPALIAFAMRSVYAALDRTRPILVSALIAVAFNALANYALVFGRLGAPALGVFGSGLATTLSQTLMLGVLAAFGRIDPRLAALRLFSTRWRLDLPALADIWRLGLPIGATIAAEISVFAVSALAMGLIGAQSLEAHTIALQIAATAFMVPLGLGQAATVRVGHAYGARDVTGVSIAGWTAFGMTLAFVTVSAATMFFAPRLLISAFLDLDAPEHFAVAALALSFLRVAALFQVFDGAQAALANMLRGVHDSRGPLAMALGGYWAIGAPIGFALGFLTDLRGLGLWIGLAIGLAAVSILLMLRWLGKERQGFGCA